MSYLNFMVIFIICTVFIANLPFNEGDDDDED
jgi:hypothetical protein